MRISYEICVLTVLFAHYDWLCGYGETRCQSRFFTSERFQSPAVRLKACRQWVASFQDPLLQKLVESVYPKIIACK